MEEIKATMLESAEFEIAFSFSEWRICIQWQTCSKFLKLDGESPKRQGLALDALVVPGFLAPSE